MARWVAFTLWVGSGLGASGLGAQIAGPTPSAPPGSDRVFELRFANDFLGRGGAIDDFRTQQLGLVARVGRRWTLVADHSILTLSRDVPGAPARVDQVTLSVGRRVLGSADDSGQLLEVGGGLRYSGDAAGARMQNGFHQLVGSTLETMPYVGTHRADGVLWVTAPRTGVFRRADGEPVLGGGWRLGYWVRASTLVSTDAEWDGSAAGLLVFARGPFQGWVGVRGDWRVGHDRDAVTRATAGFEQGGAGVLGVSVGPLVLETAQGFDGEAAFGHLSLLSSGSALSAGPGNPAGVGFEAGFSLPDVTARVLGRWWPDSGGRESGWRRSFGVEARFGQPQFGSDVDRYVDTWQLSGTVEAERAPFSQAGWLAGFGAVGVGWRQERLEGFGGPESGLRSVSAGSVGLTGEVGLRVSTTATGGRMGVVLQTGVSGWLPASGRTVDFAGSPEQLLRPVVGLTLGALVRFRVGNREP